MDPMEAYERERLLKEQEERKELEQTIGLMDFISDIKELANRGKDVHPGAKNRKDLQNVAKSLKMSAATAARKKSTSNSVDNIYEQDDEYTSDYIDLLSKPRTLLYEGVVSKRELDGRLNLSFKSSFRYLFLLSDALLITYKKDIKCDHIRSLSDTFELNHVIWMKDMRLHDILPASSEAADTNAFELIVAKTRFRDQYSLQFTCENAKVKTEFLKEISYTLYAYHKSTPISQHLGWNHRLIVGTLHSSAYLGDLGSLKRIVKGLANQSDIDAPDQLGMSALHWAVLNGHEACVRFIIEKGGDIDRIQGGMNTPFLLACCRGYDSICRILLDRGADLYARNVMDCDAVIMAVVYGHASKGLPWVLQLLTSKGLDLNGTRDRTGATPLHLCAERNLARPVRMLVDSGADVNAKHEVNKLTPLQMACKHSHPDVETIRSFLDKGAYPNWRDSEGRTAWDIIIREQQKYMISCVRSGDDMFGSVDMDMFDAPDSTSSCNASEQNHKILGSIVNTSTPNSPMGGSPVKPTPNSNCRNMRNSFRNVVDAVGEVGDWAVEALPTLLEITKRGCRFDGNMKELDNLRPSFRNAILEARSLWENSSIENVGVVKVLEFVQAREQAGETFLCDKEHWAKDDSSPHCLLCAEKFGLSKKLRRHHCRACGVLVCEGCSSKRFILTSVPSNASMSSRDSMTASNLTPTTTVSSLPDGIVAERVCDGCYNRLSYEATQPSPDHYRVRHLKMCATDLLNSISELIDALDDPDGDPNGFNHSLRATMALTNELGFGGSTRKSANVTPNKIVKSSSGGDLTKLDAMLIRDEKLSKSENLTGKFLEAADGYHRVVKKIVEKRVNGCRSASPNNTLVSKSVSGSNNAPIATSIRRASMF